MDLAWLLFLVIALGHLCLTIAVMNWSQGHGINVKWMDHAILLSLLVVGVGFLAGAWCVWATPVAFWPIAFQVYAAICLGALFIGLPLSTLARHARAEVAGTKLVSSTTHDLAGLCGQDALIGSSGAAFLLKIPGNESMMIERNEWSVTLANLPPSLDGLTILHLTDLHFAHTYQQRFFDEVVSLAIADAPIPDLVFITGDFLDHDDTLLWIEPVLSRLHARLGKIAILGNHDYRHDFRGLRRELRSAGFSTLDGRWTVVESPHGRLVVGGTSYPWGRDLDPSQMPQGDVRLLLSHAPDQFFRASQWGIDFMLCGHNHGGQIRLPVLGPILMPSRYGRRFDLGFYREANTTMFVATGVGGKHPIRFGCRPEIARLTLCSPVVAGKALASSHATFANSRLP